MKQPEPPANQYPPFLGPAEMAEDYYQWQDRLHGKAHATQKGDYEGAEMLHELAFGQLNINDFIEKYVGPEVKANNTLPLSSSDQSEEYKEYRKSYQNLLKRMEGIAGKLPAIRENSKKLNRTFTKALIDRFSELKHQRDIDLSSLSAANGVTKVAREEAQHTRDEFSASPEVALLTNAILMLNDDILTVQTKIACGKLGSVDPGDIYRTAYEIGAKAILAFDPNRGVLFSTYLTSALKMSLVTMLTRKAGTEAYLEKHGASLYAKAGDTDNAGLIGTLAVSDDIQIGVSDQEKIKRLIGILDEPNILDDRARTILKARFGVAGESETATLQELANKLGFSKERIRQVETSSLKKLEKAYLEKYAAADEQDETVYAGSSSTPVQLGAASFKAYQDNAGTPAYKYRPQRATLEEHKAKEKKRSNIGHITAEAETLNGSTHLSFEELQAEMPARFKSFLERDSVLSDPQRKVMVDDGEYIAAGHSSYHGKRPTGTGKSVSTIAKILAANTPVGSEEPAWDVPTIVLAPRRFLAEDLYKKWTDPELYGLSPKYAGIYHSQVSNKDRQEALKKPVLFTTYASFISLVKKGMLDPEHRPLIIADEVHRTKGEAIKPVLQEFFDQAHIQGWTATDTFADGKTIGYYLFGRKNEHGQIVEEKPFHVTTYPEAILENREAAPFKNIIVTSPAPAPDIQIYSDREFTKQEREKIAFAKGRDEAAIRMYAEWEDPQTNLKLRDMDSIWYCEGIEHAKEVQKKLDEVFGKGHAKAVSGETEFNELLAAQNAHREGALPALTNADLLIEGHDSKNTQLIVMLRPTRSPIVALQPGGRGLRLDPNNPGKLTYILSMIDKNTPDARVFGEEAGGMFIAPPDMQFTTNPKIPRNPVVPDSYPKLEDLEIISDPKELEDFRQSRISERAELSERRQEYGQYLRADQMASILRRRPEEISAIYDALKAAKDTLSEGDDLIRTHGLEIPKDEFKEDAPLRVHKNQLGQFKKVIGVVAPQVVSANEVRLELHPIV